MARRSKSETMSGQINAPAYPKMTEADSERERRYRAEDDIRTLKRAEEIRRDRERMSAVKQEIKSAARVVEKPKPRGAR